MVNWFMSCSFFPDLAGVYRQSRAQMLQRRCNINSVPIIPEMTAPPSRRRAIRQALTASSYQAAAFRQKSAAVLIRIEIGPGGPLVETAQPQRPKNESPVFLKFAERRTATKLWKSQAMLRGIRKESSLNSRVVARWYGRHFSKLQAKTSDTFASRSHAFCMLGALCISQLSQLQLQLLPVCERSPLEMAIHSTCMPAVG